MQAIIFLASASGGRAHLLRRFALVQDDAVCQVRRHNEVMLHDEGCFLAVHDEPLNALRRHITSSAEPLSPNMRIFSVSQACVVETVDGWEELLQ